MGKIVYTGVSLLPIFGSRFAVFYLKDQALPNAKIHLRIFLIVSLAFLLHLWGTDQFIIGYHDYWWGLCTKTGPILYAYALFVVVAALYLIASFFYGMKLEKKVAGISKKYLEYRLIFLAYTFVTLASIDFLPNWGIDIVQIGFTFVMIFTAFITYAIIKHELLGISVVIKRSLIYSIIISLMTVMYFSIVFITGNLIGDLAKAQSLPVILLIFTLITLLFKPLEQKVHKLVDRFIFKSSREEVERENVLLREELMKQDRLKAVATFASGMAHEIKNPLTSIKTFAEYLPKKYDEPEFRSKFSRIVSSEVDRVNHIIKQLLEFSRPQEPALQRENICAILEDTLELLTSHLLKSHIEVHRSYPKILLLFIDKNQMKQAFLNILLNSIQAMPGGGSLWVSLEIARSPNVVISIRDTGAGITKEELPHIFDPFHTTKESGTGLGLSIVHGIVEKHGGEIKVESTVGRGTTISVILKNLSSYTPASKASPS